MSWSPDAIVWQKNVSRQCADIPGWACRHIALLMSILLILNCSERNLLACTKTRSSWQYGEATIRAAPLYGEHGTWRLRGPWLKDSDKVWSIEIGKNRGPCGPSISNRCTKHGSDHHGAHVAKADPNLHSNTKSSLLILSILFSDWLPCLSDQYSSWNWHWQYSGSPPPAKWSHHNNHLSLPTCWKTKWRRPCEEA